ETADVGGEDASLAMFHRFHSSRRLARDQADERTREWRDAMSDVNPGLLHTVGHSTRPIEELIALLRAHGVAQLVDVRTIPRSRRHPQFDREILPGALGPAGIGYAHMGGLGGLRAPRPDSVNLGWRNAGFRGYADYMQTADFTASLERLLTVARGVSTAIMCAEAVPWRCHRSLIADALVVRG